MECLPETVEVDGRRDGITYYQLLYHLGSNCLALLAIYKNTIRHTIVPPGLAGDYLVHPEFYLIDAEHEEIKT